MSNSMVTEALSEIDGIAKALGCQGDDLTLIQVDAAVGSVKPWKGAKSLSLQGRGGTDLRVGFDAAEEMRNPSNVIICLSDGETPWPERRPRNGASVIVGIIGTPQQRAWNIEGAKNAMPWAQVVEIGNDKD
jgi:predicted metal-dependent peptidase